MTEFYTIGLPRTRSLWLTYLLRSDNADCYHEALGVMGETELPKTNKKYIGSCDNNPLNYTERAPLLIVERNVNEVIDSVLESFKNPFDMPFKPFIDGLINKKNEALKKFDGKRINHNDLNDFDCVLEIIKFLKPDEEINKHFVFCHMHSFIETTVNDLSFGMKMLANHYKMSVNEFYEYIVRG